MIVGLSKQLRSSAEQGNVVTIRTLLSKNAVQVDSADQACNTSLMYAAKEGHVAAVRILLQHGANPDLTNSYGWSALMQASINGHIRCVKCLLEYGADTNIINQFKQTALVHAASHGHTDIVQALLSVILEDRTDTEQVRHQMSLALSYAAYNAQIATVRLLLHYNADINHCINEGNWNALLYSILGGDTNVCQILLNSSQTSLTYDHLPLVFEVLRNSSVDKSLLMDKVPLPESSRDISTAIEQGDLEALQKVIGLADAESNRLMGGTPLMFASVMGQNAIVRWLLETGTDINDQDDNNGWTALMQAVFHGHYRIVEYLLAAGADPNISNNDGLNAHSIASMLNDEHMSDMLVRHCRVFGESPGKHWWKKLTTKFSTIRALTAFKTRLRDINDMEGEGSGSSSQEPVVDTSPTSENSAKKIVDEKESNIDNQPTSEINQKRSILSQMSITSTHIIEVAPIIKDDDGEGDIPEETAQDYDEESSDGEDIENIETENLEQREEGKKETEEERAHKEKEEEGKEKQLKKEVRLNNIQGDNIINLGGDIKGTDVTTTDLSHTSDDIKSCDNIKLLKYDQNHDLLQPAIDIHQIDNQEHSLPSPDSGFISRADASSLPLSSDITQSEYDGLDVDLPELPPDLALIEPNYDWYPADIKLDEDTLRSMQVDEDIIRELNKLNVLF